MDNFKNIIKTSVFEACGQSLDSAFSLYDAKIEEAGETAKLADQERVSALARVKGLESDIAILRAEIRQNEALQVELGASVITRTKELHRNYAPEDVLSNTLGGQDHRQCTSGKLVDSKYRELYRVASELIYAHGQLAVKVERQKKKLAKWQDYLDSDEFTIVLDGGLLVTFRRVQEMTNVETCMDKVQPRTSGPNIEPSEIVERGSGGEASTRAMSLFTTQNSRSRTETNPETGINQNRPQLPCTGQSNLASTPGSPFESEENATHSTNPSGYGMTHVQTAYKEQGAPSPDSQTRNSRCRDSDRNDNDTGPPAVIKNESASPSPLQSPPQNQAFNFFGTQDLEETGIIIETPKKRTSGTHRNTRSVPDKSASNSDSDCHQRHDCYQRPSRGRNLAKRPTADSDTRDASPINRQAEVKKRKTQAIPLVAEDGDESYFDSGAMKATSKPALDSDLGQSTVGSRSVGRRLENFLEGSSSCRTPLIFEKGPTKPASVDYLHRDSDNRTKRNTPIQHCTEASNNRIDGSQSPQTREMPSVRDGRRSLNHDNALPRVRPEDKSYRARPIHRLSLSDFKVNPAVNQGDGSSYKPGFLKKYERNCLPGCVSEDCCGPVLRAMARHLPRQEDEDQKMLEEYLGDDSHVPARMGDDEREKLLLDAKTWFLANRHGKHRYKQQRQRSPPGFWRTDMPDTQELEHDREETRRLERQMVMERRREAMRPDGLWKFADE